MSETNIKRYYRTKYAIKSKNGKMEKLILTTRCKNLIFFQEAYKNHNQMHKLISNKDFVFFLSFSNIKEEDKN